MKLKQKKQQIVLSGLSCEIMQMANTFFNLAGHW